MSTNLREGTVEPSAVIDNAFRPRDDRSADTCGNA
jgi:hypothetical protein